MTKPAKKLMFKNNRQPIISDLAAATEMHLITLQTRSRGNTMQFLDAIWPRLAKAQSQYMAGMGAGAMDEIGGEEIDSVAGDFTPEVAVVIDETGCALWTGTINRRGIELRHGNTSWRINGKRAIYEDGHDNRRVYVQCIIRDKSAPTRTREGWDLVEARQTHRVVTHHMPDTAYGAVTMLMAILKGGVVTPESPMGYSIGVLQDYHILDFVECMESWSMKMSSKPVTWRNQLAAAEFWYDMLDKLQNRDPYGHTTRFACDFMIPLLAITRHIDDGLQRKLYTQLRKRMNSLANPQSAATPKTIYTYGPQIFEAVDKALREQADRMAQ